MPLQIDGKIDPLLILDARRVFSPLKHFTLISTDASDETILKWMNNNAFGRFYISPLFDPQHGYVVTKQVGFEDSKEAVFFTLHNINKDTIIND